MKLFLQLVIWGLAFYIYWPLAVMLFAVCVLLAIKSAERQDRIDLIRAVANAPLPKRDAP